MYADRYSHTSKASPVSLAMSLGLSSALVAALVFAGGVVGPAINADPPPFTGTNIPIDPPPPEVAPEIKQTVKPIKRDIPPPLRPDTTTKRVETTTGAETIFTGSEGTEGGTGTGTGPVTVYDPPKPPPVLTEAIPDPRFARDFQPPYPPGEIRSQNEGRVVVRVLIGTDGRVVRVERVSATTDLFYEATLRRALAKWRFKPATRDGVAIETWRQMAVRFTLLDS